MIKIYNMDVMKALKQIPDESVDMQITSPPYWGLRDYGEGTENIWEDCIECEHEFKEDGFCKKCLITWKGQLGLEPTFDLYIKHLCDIFDEVKRVLKKEGTCWINLGDTYSGSGQGSQTGYGDYKREKVIGSMDESITINTGISAKCLCAIPERFIIEMISRGWILRNKIIWHKPNHMPTSVKDRFANSWEYLFMFSKSKKYYFDLDAVREAHKEDSFKRAIRGTSGQDKQTADNPIFGFKKEFSPRGILDERALNPKGKNPDDVIQTKFQIGDSYRQGMNRDETELIEVRPALPPQEEIVGFLQEWTNGFEDTLDEEFGEYKWRHWIRIDNSGFSYPSRRDWITLKNMLNFTDTYDKQMLDFVLKPNTVSENPLGKNPSDFWDITTRGYPEAHFAVFPEALVERPIKTTPKWICNKCRKAKKVIGKRGIDYGFNIRVRDVKEGRIKHSDRKASEKEIENYEEGEINRRDDKYTISEGCKCNAGFHPAVIMDIFCGSGTTLKVARRLNRNAIGIEIKPEYCNLIRKRLFGNNQTLFPNEFEVIKDKPLVLRSKS